MNIKKIYNNFLSGNKRSIIVKKNIIASLFIKLCSIIISLMLVPMTLGYMSSEMYGIWLTVSSIIVWFHFFDIGFTLGLKNKLAEAIAMKDWKRGKALVSTTYIMMVVIFLPLCVILEIFVPFIKWSSLLNVNTIYEGELKMVMYALFAFLCLQMVAHVITSIVAAYQKTALSSAFSVIGQALALIAIYVCTKLLSPSLLVLSFVLTGMPILVLIIASVILFSTKYKSISPSINCYEKRYIKEIFNLGLRFFLIQIQFVVLFQTTNILISNLSGPNDVTSYNIAYKYISVAMMLFNILLSPLWPAFTEAKVKEDYCWMNNVYNKYLKIYILFAICLALMVLVSPVVYHYWIGNKAEVPFIMTSIVAIYISLYAWDNLQVTLLNGLGILKVQTYITVIGLVLHIPLSFFLGRFIGCLGVVVSMIIINMIYSIFTTIQLRKILLKTATGIWLK